MFCLMGSCQECVVRIDGKLVPACQEADRATVVSERFGERGSQAADRRNVEGIVTSFTAHPVGAEEAPGH